jgi:hypothetical protein
MSTLDKDMRTGNVQRNIMTAVTQIMPRRQPSSAVLTDFLPAPVGDSVAPYALLPVTVVDGGRVVLLDGSSVALLDGPGCIVVIDVTNVVEPTVATTVAVTSTSEVTVVKTVVVI